VNWDHLRYFLAVHRQGSHKRAARLLRVDATTVSRRIALLEGAARATLFVRTPERLMTTPAGMALLAHSERIEAEVLASERELLADPVVLAGPLRVTAGDALVNHVVVPAMGELLAAHPDLVVELRTETAIVDLTRREADIALRFVRPKEPALVARRLGELPFAIFASDAYLRRRGAPRTLAAAATHDFVGYPEALDHMPQVRWLHRTVRSPRYVLRASTLTTQLIACAAGLGLALLPVFSAGREPAIRRLFPRQAGPTRELWSAFHGDLRGNARVSTFLGWLSNVLASHVKAPGRQASMPG
jgi:DNA-binding transcriptional LysR family regulator